MGRVGHTVYCSLCVYSEKLFPSPCINPSEPRALSWHFLASRGTELIYFSEKQIESVFRRNKQVLYLCETGRIVKEREVRSVFGAVLHSSDAID